MKKIKMIALLLVLAITGSLLGGCGGSTPPKEVETPEEEQQYVLQLAGAYPSTEDTPRALASKKIKEVIEEKSGGKIKVELYLDSQLGGDREILEACQAGNIAMVGQTTAPQVGFIPELAIFDIPMLFENLEVAKKTLSGPYIDKLAKKYEEAGLKLLMFEPIYYRETTANRPLEKLEDFKGLKIRTMENKYHMAFWQELGANPTPLNFAELYIALQQGTVDAQENPYEIVWGSKFYEVQDYLINTRHICFIFTVVMDKDLYDSMPAEYRKLIDDSMAEASEWLYQEALAQNEAMLSTLKDLGMTVLDLSPQLREDLLKAAAVVEDMVRQDIGDEAVDELMQAIEQAR